jgi:hypothetical protein
MFGMTRLYVNPHRLIFCSQWATAPAVDCERVRISSLDVLGGGIHRGFAEEVRVSDSALSSASLQLRYSTSVESIGNTIAEVDVGFLAEDSTPVLIHDSFIADNGIGIRIHMSSNITVTGSTIARNRDVRPLVQNSTDVLVHRNDLIENSKQAVVLGGVASAGTWAILQGVTTGRITLDRTIAAG